MPFNIKTEKILSPSNIKKIIMLGISLRDELSNMELGLISDYDNTKTYTRGQAVYYNNYLYKCLYTTTGTWDSTKWQKIGDELDLITKVDIEAMLGLTQDQLDTLASIILDSEVRLDKTWSSSKIYTDLQQCLNDSKKFTLDQFAKANKASYQVITNLSSATDKSIIYLMANGSNYDMYIVESDGTPTKIGDTTIDLSQFYTKTEIDNDFVKKTDADGKYATITTVDGKVDKTSILSTISSTPSDNKLLSEKAINDTLVKKIDIVDNLTSTDTDKPLSANQGKILNDNKVDKTSIVTTINFSSTNDKVPSAKSIYYNCIEGIELNQTVIDTYGTEIIKYPLGIWRIDSNILASQFTDLPDKTSGRIEITSINPNTNIIPWNSQYSYRVYNFETYGGENYIRKIESGSTVGVISHDSGWKKVCTTSVADVPVTNIAPADETKFIGFKGNPNCSYCVRNGICYVSFWTVQITSAGGTLFSGVILPKCANGHSGVLMTGNQDSTPHAYAFVYPNTGELCFNVKDANVNLYGSFSYPVAES